MFTPPPSTTMPRFVRSRRTAAALTVSALVTALLGLTAASPAQATGCTLTPGTTASVLSVKVAPLYIRGAKTDFPIPVTVSVCDPAGLVQSGDAILGIKLLDPTVSGALLDLTVTDAPPVGVGDVKTYSYTLYSYYLDKAYGPMDVGAEILDGPVASPTAVVLDEMWVHTAVKSRTYLTNTPSSTTVKRGGTTVIRGILRRFDGTPMANQRVAIKVVPAGWTHGSFAGYARTTSTGAYALTVRAYYTGSWYVNYAGDATAVSSYKAAWVRVTV